MERINIALPGHYGISLAQAVSRAAHQSVGQIRRSFKDGSIEEYFHHPHRVADAVINYWVGENETIDQFLNNVLNLSNGDAKSIQRVLAMIYAAYMHDVLEDTGMTRADIRDLFGELTLRYVIGLTSLTSHIDTKIITRTLRKAIDRCRMYNLDEDTITEVCQIKTYDFIDNWQHDFKYCERRTYYSVDYKKRDNRVRYAVEYMLSSVVYIAGIAAKGRSGQSDLFMGIVNMLIQDFVNFGISNEVVQEEIQRQVRAWLDNSISSKNPHYDGIDNDWMYVKGTKDPVVQVVWDELKNLERYVATRYELHKQ